MNEIVNPKEKRLTFSPPSGKKYVSLSEIQRSHQFRSRNTSSAVNTRFKIGQGRTSAYDKIKSVRRTAFTGQLLFELRTLDEVIT